MNLPMVIMYLDDDTIINVSTLSFRPFDPKRKTFSNNQIILVQYRTFDVTNFCQKKSFSFFDLSNLRSRERSE